MIRERIRHRLFLQIAAWVLLTAFSPLVVAPALHTHKEQHSCDAGSSHHHNDDADSCPVCQFLHHAGYEGAIAPVLAYSLPKATALVIVGQPALTHVSLFSFQGRAPPVA